MIDVMLSKATEGMLIAELLNRRNDKEVPLFMGGKSNVTKWTNK